MTDVMVRGNVAWIELRSRSELPPRPYLKLAASLLKSEPALAFNEPYESVSAGINQLKSSSGVTRC